MPQTSYPLDRPAALAGTIVSRGRMRGRYECSEDLHPGRIAEFNAGALRLPQATGSTLAALGAIPYTADLPPGGYLAGFAQVPVMRSGQVWLEYVGTAPTVESTPNVSHSSTVATDRGKITGSATSTTAGSEIAAGPAGLIVVKVDTVTSLALCELNLP